MSSRQPASNSRTNTASTNAAVLPPNNLLRVIISLCAGRLMRHLRNRNRLQTLHKSLCINNIKLWVGGLYAQEELVACHSGELFHVEQWVIRHRQTIQGKHPEDAGESGEQNRHLEGRNDERRPRIIGLAANIQRIGNDVDPVLQRKARKATQQSAEQHDQRHTALVEADCLTGLLDWKWTVGIHLAVTGRIGCLGGLDQLGRGVELCYQSVDGRCKRLMTHFAFTSASGSRVRISKIEMAGIMRMKISIAAVKKPRVPARTA